VNLTIKKNKLENYAGKNSYISRKNKRNESTSN